MTAKHAVERPIWQRVLRRAIDERDIKGIDAAKVAKMSTGQFSDIVNNPAQNPTVETLARMAAAVGISMSDLFPPEGSPDAASRSIPQTDLIALISPAIRIAFGHLLTDILAGLGREDQAIDRQAAGAGLDPAAHRDLSARHRRAVR